FRSRGHLAEIPTSSPADARQPSDPDALHRQPARTARRGYGCDDGGPTDAANSAWCETRTVARNWPMRLPFLPPPSANHPPNPTPRKIWRIRLNRPASHSNASVFQRETGRPFVVGPLFA